MGRMHEQPNMKRRELIGKSLIAATAATVAPGILLTVAKAKSETEGVNDSVRWGLLIDSNRCADGCTSCVDACDQENGIDLIKRPEGQTDEAWNAQRPQWIRKVKLRDRQTEEVTNFPLMCQHCEYPPCVDVCPTGASFKRADGVVMVDRHTCIGCRYCMMACPYKARSFIHQDVSEQSVRSPRGKGCVESCNLCVTRIDSGMRTTACQDACNKENQNAILFGDLKDSESAIFKALQAHTSRQIRADLELNTGVRYTNL